VTPRTAFIALGSNLGDREAWLALARRELEAIEGLRVVAVTPVEETAPLGGLSQPAYLNAMVRATFTGATTALLEACHAIEAMAGRERHDHWGSRTLDLDLVVVENELCDRPDLTLPHPGLRDRGFWVRQLAELERHG
jgi:2-amino-4-hydroxy-6-hydroxymethyldihydropteridine diphosphokinase